MDKLNEDSIDSLQISNPGTPQISNPGTPRSVDTETRSSTPQQQQVKCFEDFISLL